VWLGNEAWAESGGDRVKGRYWRGRWGKGGEEWAVGVGGEA